MILIPLFILTSLGDLISTLWSIRSVAGIKESFIWMRWAIKKGTGWAMLLQAVKTFLILALFFDVIFNSPELFKWGLVLQQGYAIAHNIRLYRRVK